MNADLEFQMKRMYAAIGAAEERNPVRLRATVRQSERWFEMYQDFRGGQTDAQLMITAQSLISNVAVFHEHLKKWARNNDRNPKKLDEAVEGSFELRVILDLADRDRHPYPPRNHGKSDKSPTLSDVNRVMQLSTRPVKGSPIGMQGGLDGLPRFFGDGDARAVVTGDVVSMNGERIGDLQDIVGKAIEALRRVMVDYEIARGI